MSIVVVLAATVALVAPPAVARAAPVPAMSAEQAATLWNAYGDAGGHWTGADGTTSVKLPDGRVVWIFADTYLGTVNPDHSRPGNSPMVHNTMVVQSGVELVETRHGGTASAPQSLVGPTGGDEWLWPNDGTVAGGELRVLYNRYTRTGSGQLDFALEGTSLARFALPSLIALGVQDLPLGDRISWGSALFDDGGFTYVYGTEHVADSGLKFAHVARVPTGALGGPWQFWTGAGWSDSESASRRLLSGVGTGFSVERLGGQVVLLTHDTSAAFGAHFAAHTAAEPTGPFGPPAYLFTAPEPDEPGQFVYDARIHPELSRSGRILVSYNVNTFAENGNIADARVYRPRFVEVPVPFPGPGSGVPARPTGLTVRASGDVATLTWATPAGTITGYHVYQRDVTAGQTHFARIGRPVAGAATDVPFLRDDHVYEFRATALNSAGEGPPSDPVSVTIDVAPPAAPTGPRVTMTATGTAELAWNAVAGPVRYQVYRRDVTDGQTEFTKVVVEDTMAVTATVTGLADGHEYEFKVTALNGAGEGPASAVVRGTARIAPPAAPTGLTAAAQGDGSVLLTWQAPAPNLAYWIYQRDVTAGEPAFRRLEYPVMTGTTARPGLLLAGHVYEFRVTAVNGGGEGPQSTTVAATARWDAPAAPTGLTAAAQSDGSVLLGWQAPAPNLAYWIYQRDVTAGETTFTKLEYPVMTGTSARPGGLTAGHRYEYRVSAANAGGEGPQSAPASATARWDAPATPTGLTATAGDGQVELAWADGGPDVWYWIYRRDVTAGDTAFTRSEYPVTAGPSATLGLLTNGHTYEFRVSAINAGGEGPQSATVSAKPMPPRPGKPTGLTAAPRADGAVVLTWTAPGPGLWYWVYRRDVTAGETAFTKLTYPATDPTATIGGLAHNHRYEFMVAGTNAAGDGPTSDPVAATASYAPPAAPANLRGITAGANAIELRWDAPAPDLYYYVYRRDVTAGDTSFTKSSLPVAGTSTTHGLLTHDHTYEFKVTAVNAGGEGPASATIAVVAKGFVPEPPSGLTAVAGNREVRLSWTASPTPNVYYWVYLRDVTAGQAFTRQEYFTANTNVTLTPLVNGHTYEFRVTATNAVGDSGPSNTATARPMPPLPAAPTGLTSIADDGAVGLGWDATPNAESWWVYVRDVTAGQSGFTRLPYPTTNWWLTVTPLANGHTYEFRVSAVNAAGEGPLSAVTTARPVPPAPQPPRNLSATAGDKQVRLTWQASPTPNVYYWVYYRPQGQSDWYYVQYPVNGTSFTHTPLYIGFTYEYRVTAANLGGQSAPSNTVSARPVAPLPQPPRNLSATAGDKQVRLTWQASPTPNVYYWVYYRPQGQSDWYYVQYPVNGTSFTHTPLYNGFTYEYRVTAANAAGQSSPSNTVSARPLPPPPAAPRLSVWSDSPNHDRMNLLWNASGDPNMLYELCYRRALTSAGWVCRQYPMSEGGYGTYTQMGYLELQDNEWYDFRITAVNGGGRTASNVVRELFRSRRYVYTWFTGPYASDQYWWQSAKNNQGDWSTYSFNWSDNGCSAPILGDNPFGFPFGTPCKRHDFGYGNHDRVGMNSQDHRYRIDWSFLEDMRRVCSGYTGKRKSDCDEISAVYYYAVRQKGGSHW